MLTTRTLQNNATQQTKAAISQTTAVQQKTSEKPGKARRSFSSLLLKALASFVA